MIHCLTCMKLQHPGTNYIREILKPHSGCEVSRHLGGGKSAKARIWPQIIHVGFLIPRIRRTFWYVLCFKRYCSVWDFHEVHVDIAQTFAYLLVWLLTVAWLIWRWENCTVTVCALSSLYPEATGQARHFHSLDLVASKIRNITECVPFSLSEAVQWNILGSML